MTPELLQEFKTIFLEEFGIELSDTEALEHARAVIDVFEIVWRPIPPGQLELYKSIAKWYTDGVQHPYES